MHIFSLLSKTQYTIRGNAVQSLIPTLLTKTAIAAGFLALAACGGGGDGTSSTPAPTPVLAQALTTSSKVVQENVLLSFSKVSLNRSGLPGMAG